MPSRTRSRTDLDRPATYQRLDPRGMLGFAVDFPAQVAEAAQIGRRFGAPASLRNPAAVVIAGMGGSAVVGDFLARLCEDRTAAPVIVCRHYQPPAIVGPRTLFVASSHSGNTEETLAAAQAARRRGARMLCITTGGKLAAFAQRHQIPLIRIPQTDPPMPPRAALGYSFIPLASVFGALGLLPSFARHFAEAQALLARLRDQLRPEVPARANRAKQLAHALHGRIPWVHGTVGVLSAAAYRWRCQFNENSKMLAYSAEYPELNHNEVVGWEVDPALARRIAVIALESPGDHRRVRARVAITREIIGGKAPVHIIEAEGRSPLARLVSAVYLGDFTSLYLAFLNRVDPSSIAAINELKRRLAEL